MGSKTLISFTKLEKQEKKKLIFSLEDGYNCELKELFEYNYYVTSKDKVYISSVDPTQLPLNSINSIGLYFGTFHSKDKFRLSIEGTKFVKPKKNYIILKDSKALASYLAAENLFEEDIAEKNIQTGTPYIIVLYNNQQMGCVSNKENYYLTYMPKSRKLDYNKVF